jgi:DNA-binding NarL/FixJ family response regulator
MSAVLYFGNDQRVTQMVHEYFAKQRQLTGKHATVAMISSIAELKEALIAMTFDVLFFEHSLLPETPIEYIRQFKLAHPKVKGKLVLVGDVNDTNKLFHFLEAGWTDYIIIPPDKPLIIEKITLYAKGVRPVDRQVYSLKTSQPADIAKPANIEELSEFDCKVNSQFPSLLGEVVILYSEALGESDGLLGSAIVRCYKSEAHPTIEGHFINSYNFIGVTQGVLQNIRNTLRKTYISYKK